MSVEVNLKMKVRDFKQLSDFLDSHEYDIAASIDAYGDLKQLFKLVFGVEPSNGDETLKGIKINTNDIKDMLLTSQGPTGKFFVGAKLYFYEGAGIVPNRVIYSDQALSHAIPNPAIADCNGNFPTIFINPDDGYYKIGLADSRDFMLLMTG
jgi:hypothetical protein